MVNNALKMANGSKLIFPVPENPDHVNSPYTGCNITMYDEESEFTPQMAQMLVDRYLKKSEKVFLLQITEYAGWYDSTIEYIKAAYSSYPTKKQLGDVFRELHVKSPVFMVKSMCGDVTYDEYIHLRYEIIEMPLL